MRQVTVRWLFLIAAIILVGDHNSSADETPEGVITSVRSGNWSDAATWSGGKVPGQGARVLVREGNTIVYDVASDRLIRAINVAGTLTFATNKDTRLDVGLIKIQAGDEFSENGFDCAAHIESIADGKTRPALAVGAPDQPVDANHTALIRLVHVQGMDRESCPAIVCCGGRMDFHGAPMSRTWVKLGTTGVSLWCCVATTRPSTS